MGLFSRAKTARAAGKDDPERARAEDAYADVILALDALPVADRGEFMAIAEQLAKDIRRVAAEAGAQNKLMQIESELRTLERRINRAAG